MRKLIIGALAASVLAIAAARAAPVRIVAAENFYGDVAHQIGGAHVAVTSILFSPDQDPHQFEARASTARAIADAQIVVYNGIGYDTWAVKLLAASSRASRTVIDVAALIHKKSGDNPHIWYDPATMPAFAQTLAAALSRLDPAHRAFYAARLDAFRAAMKPLNDRVAALRARYAGTPVTATEPVFGYMAAALGLKMRNAGFQLAVMNGTEPSARDIAAFETDLRRRAVRALFYNDQTGDKLTQRMRVLARAAGIPVIGVSETEPEGKNYQEWMLSQLDALDQALRKK